MFVWIPSICFSLFFFNDTATTEIYPLSLHELFRTTEPAAWCASRPVSRRMVRVPKLPLSMTAVDSNTPSSISTTDMGVRMASLEFLVQLFRVGTANSGTTRDAATAIDRSGRDFTYPAATTEDRAIRRALIRS